MRILITGAGMLGCHAAAHLSELGHRVVLYDVAPNSTYIDSIVDGRNVSVCRGEITQIGSLTDVLLKEKIEGVIHTAGLIGGRAQESPFGGFQVNLGGTLAVAEACRVAGVRRIVYAGTHGVYALDRIRQAPFTESAPTLADTVYAATKLSSEHVLEAFGRAFSIDIISLRFANVFGRGEFKGGSSGGIAFDRMILSAVHGTPAPIGPALIGNGEWLYAKDAANALGKAVTRETNAPGFLVINVGSGILHNEQDFMTAVRTVLPAVQFSLPKAASAPRSTVRHQPFDLSAARKYLDFRPTFDLTEAVRDYVTEVMAVSEPFPSPND